MATVTRLIIALLAFGIPAVTLWLHDSIASPSSVVVGLLVGGALYVFMFAIARDLLGLDIKGLV